MPSDLEALSLDGTSLNNQTTWFAESIEIPPPSKRLQRLASADADSDVLADVARYDLRTVTVRLRYVGGIDTDDALDAINALSGQLQQAEEIDAGLPLTWTPTNSTYTGTLYVQSGEITHLPLTSQGDDAGWFFAQPVVTLRLDCFPFIHGTEYTAGTMAATSDRIGILTAADVPGDVPGLGRLVITDTGSQNRNHVEIGGDRYGYAAAPSADFDILGSEMTALGGSLTGSGAGSYVSMSVGTTPVAICEAASLPHVGPHTIRVQVERVTASTLLYVRSASRTVDGPWQYSPWRSVPMDAGTYDLYLGQTTFSTVKAGTQESTVRIEAYANEATTARIYRINPFPTEVVYALMRTKSPTSIPAATSYTYVDNFTVASPGADLAGEAPNVGSGTWSESGSATNFTYVGSYDFINRNTSSEAAPHFATIGSAIGAQGASIRAHPSGTGFTAGQTLRAGVVLRYVDTSNYLAAGVTLVSGSSSVGTIAVWEVVAGTTTVLYTGSAIGAIPASGGIQAGYRVTAAAVDGDWFVRVAYESGGILGVSPVVLGPTLLEATGFRTSLFSGALATGKVGIYDWNGAASSTNLVRIYNDFYAWSPSTTAVLHSGRTLQVRHDSAIREIAAGSKYGEPPSYRGNRLFIPPAGPDGLTTRVIIKDRRTDVDGSQPDSADTARSATLYATPRWLVAPGA